MYDVALETGSIEYLCSEPAFGNVNAVITPGADGGEPPATSIKDILSTNMLLQIQI